MKPSSQKSQSRLILLVVPLGKNSSVSYWYQFFVVNLKVNPKINSESVLHKVTCLMCDTLLRLSYFFRTHFSFADQDVKLTKRHKQKVFL